MIIARQPPLGRTAISARSDGGLDFDRTWLALAESWTGETTKKRSRFSRSEQSGRAPTPLLPSRAPRNTEIEQRVVIHQNWLVSTMKKPKWLRLRSEEKPGVSKPKSLEDVRRQTDQKMKQQKQRDETAKQTDHRESPRSERSAG